MAGEPGWLDIAAKLGLPAASGGLAYVSYVARDIRNQLRVLNGRTIRLETWKEEHASPELNRLAANIHELRDELTPLKVRGSRG